MLLVVIVLFCRKYAPQVAAWIVLSFIPFLLSPINWENHFWAFQMQVHFSLLFLFATLYFWFDERQRWSDMLLGSSMAILGVYSFSGGLVTSIASLFVFGVFKVLRLFRRTEVQDRRKEILQLLAVFALVGCALALWFVGYHNLPRDPDRAVPFSKSYWFFFINLVGFGFGLDTVEFITNSICLLLILTPVIWLVLRKESRLSNSSWAIFTAVLALLCTFAVIALGRASFVAGQTKGSRYSEVGMMLIPLAVIAWGVALQSRKWVRSLLLIGLWVFCFLTFLDNWSQFSMYDSAARLRKGGALCVARYYAGKGGANCPSLYPMSLADKLDAAQKLNVSFYRNLGSTTALEHNSTGMTVIDKDTLYAIDTLNGQLLSSGKPLTIDSQNVSEMTITGWAVDLEGRRDAADVLIVIDGKEEIPTIYGFARPDVAEVHKNSAYRFSGFSGTFPISILEKGTHKLGLKIPTFAGGCYLTKQIEIELR